MKLDKAIKKFAYVTLIALLLLLFWCYWVSTQIDQGASPSFLADGMITPVSTACALVALFAAAYAILIVLNAFYIGLTGPEKEK
jgi:hypothetical protein